MKSSFEKNSGTYRQVGDFKIPKLILSPEEANITLGKWGLLYKDYLLKNKKVLFTTLLVEGKLYQHCAEIENQARSMFNTLVEQMKEAEGVTEQLKEENQLEWICRMHNIEAMARETICEDIIHV
ncbi:MAG: TnpV protein [Clostridia bacterium]|nr:TnpV protein [Clostridia bacterium]